MNHLLSIIDPQLTDDVELLIETDNKELAISKKRELIYRKAKGVYCVQIDDDDEVTDNYIEVILKACKSGKDCIGYKELVRMKGRELISQISLRFKEWKTLKDGFERTPFYKVPIKTGIARKVLLPEMRYGEDHEFSKAIYSLLNNEQYIDQVLYIYYSPDYLTESEKKKRYGIA